MSTADLNQYRIRSPTRPWRTSEWLIFSLSLSPAIVPTMARVGTFAIPGFVLILIWIVVIILVIILLAWIVHLIGGGLWVLKLGHFSMQIGVN